jgi:hypothetical protein
LNPKSSAAIHPLSKSTLPHSSIENLMQEQRATQVSCLPKNGRFKKSSSAFANAASAPRTRTSRSLSSIAVRGPLVFKHQL